MALIVDPDLLNDGTEISINVSTLKITLTVAGNLSTDGVTIKCVYSKLKELWRTNDTYIKFPFPMGPITDEQFELINSWDWFNDSTRYLLRTGGWAKKHSSGISEQEFAGIIGLGSLGGTDQVYFQQGLPAAAGSGSVNFQLQGQVNQAICVYSSGGTPGTFDYRSYLRLFCRTFGKTYAYSDLPAIGVTTMTYQAYRFPLSNDNDPKVTLAASAMSGAPYTSINVAFYTAAQSRTIGTPSYNFHEIIEGANQNAEDIYMRIQYLLTLNSNIQSGGTAGVQVGNVSPLLLSFVGDTMYTKFYTNTPTGGTYIDNFQADDINRIVFYDDNNTPHSFPFTSTLTINFGDNLVTDTSSKYWVYFTNDDPPGDNLGQDYGTTSAVLVRDASNVQLTGSVGGVSTVQRTFAYDTNVQRGSATSGTDAPITAVAVGLSGAQFVKTTGSIQRSVSNSVSLVAALERNYQNP